MKTRTKAVHVFCRALLICAFIVTPNVRGEENDVSKNPDKADWWSFKPAVRPALPTPKNKKWSRTEIDRFILAKLEEQNLSPSRHADRVTLIRRVTFDLTGLPPTPEEVQKFVSDRHSRAYENLVDRLLASPRYGERWARHWLDTVHYADTHGYDKDKPRLNAWPYRDYVIRAFNEDKPYSRFVQEQLAGDVLFSDEPDGIVALGFIAAGPWDFVGHVELPIEKTDGLIARYNDRDDMVMTAMSTFQSLTVHCARCHNHKFDPIMQKDYYSLQAVFAGVDRAETNYDQDKSAHVRRRSLKKERQVLNERLISLTNQVAQLTSPELQQIIQRIDRKKTELATIGAEPDEKSPSNGYHSGIEKTPKYTKWVQVDLGEARKIEEIRLIPARPIDFPDTPGFGFPPRFLVEISNEPEFKNPELLADLTAGDFASPGDKPFPIIVNSQTARYVRVTAKKLWKRTDDYVFALAELQVFSNGTNVAYRSEVSALDSIEAGFWSKKFLVDGYSSRAKLQKALPSAEQKRRRAELESEVQQLEKRRKETADSLIDPAAKSELTKTQNRLAEIEKEYAALPAERKVFTATSNFIPDGNFVPAKVPRPVHLLKRGDVKRPEDEMNAAGLSCVPGADAQFEIGDLNNEAERRAALAKWITDPRNMLTRRSIVNRVWHYHFGRGIVDSPNDFGHMGSLPSHPELLDWLAFWFLENGESLKKLHRLIVTSTTYQQSSASNDQFAKIDGDNRFLWRMNRTRLDAETIHDSMLLISGKLDVTMGGPSVQQFYFKDDHSPVYDYTRFDVESAAANRRSIYRFVVRSVPDPLMDSLDCPDASILTPKRNVTMTSLQALAILNNPFVLKQCEHLARRVEKAGSSKKQIEQVYQLALNRKPTGKEMKKLLPFAQEHGMPAFCRLIFNTSEFMFLD